MFCLGWLLRKTLSYSLPEFLVILWNLEYAPLMLSSLVLTYDRISEFLSPDSNANRRLPSVLPATPAS